ncbi:MAG: glycosyltransferase [Massilibacteroides sp.]|nr:glycosyltransferase [Massilibacteroides sp.]MDD3062600.1 glycosyltransferase [Massilibacteroides sp.]MDD4116188.1 glycosyltransferase [Massilibacteroides sp.]MDD4660133.1 glycosyltransferase [Massilibacteroides sp.]
MISVLINAYACNPNWGSEPGMGWNWVINIARHCRVFVITEGEWKEEIEMELLKFSNKENIRFYYLPVSEKIRRICWNQGDWRFYYYYRQWQIQALHLARQIINENHIDIVHQLNMIGFREPGFLWKLKDISYVWGPIGGMNIYPNSYLKNLDLKQYCFVRLKNTINRFQIRFSIRVRKAIKRANALIAATPEVQSNLKDIYKKQTILINETGCYPQSNPDVDYNRFSEELFQILWVGRFFYAKQLSIALHSVAQLKDLPNWKFHIVGDGSEAQNSYYKEKAKKFGIAQNCVWHGKIENQEVHALMKKSQLFFFTSVSEATSTVVLEALVNNLPILCFNTCGFGVVVDKSVGEKIELSTPEQSATDFAQKIRELYKNRNLLIEKSKNTLDKVRDMSWNVKMEKLVFIYDSILKK